MKIGEYVSDLKGKYHFALSGRYYDPLSSGCMDLIQKGAKLVYTPEDILEEFGILCKNFVKNISNKKISLAKKEKLVYDCLRLEPRHIDEIVNECQMPVSEVLSI
ncbi:MAG: DNA-protecting protein DprA, partial [Lachnospiraceae bacterium]|nr:DNA-protecting protein DprA [Lachnospiraceae bacterium]